MPLNLYRSLGACTLVHPMTAERGSPRLALRVAAMVLGGASWLAWRGLSTRPDLAEHLMGSGPLAELPRLLSLATGVVPVSVAELLLVGLLVRYLVRSIRARREGLPWTRALSRLGADAGILLALFYLLWGFHYARPGLEERLGVPARGEATVDEIAEMAEALVERTNVLYVNGSPERVRSHVAGLDEGWRIVRDRYGLDERLVRPHGAPKSFLFLPVVRHFRIAGVHVPWTGEALVMGDLPVAALPKSVAHEMAHQRGVTGESDANTLAYLVAAASPERAHRYAAAFFLQRQYLAELSVRDPARAAALIRRRLPGVQRDVDALVRYWDRSSPFVGGLARQANDAMLRSHGIAEGISDYGGSVWTVLALARRDGLDSVLPPLDPQASANSGAGGRWL